MAACRYPEPSAAGSVTVSCRRHRTHRAGWADLTIAQGNTTQPTEENTQENTTQPTEEIAQGNTGTEETPESETQMTAYTGLADLTIAQGNTTNKETQHSRQKKTQNLKHK